MNMRDRVGRKELVACAAVIPDPQFEATASIRFICHCIFGKGERNDPSWSEGSKYDQGGLDRSPNNCGLLRFVREQTGVTVTPYWCCPRAAPAKLHSVACHANTVTTCSHATYDSSGPGR